MRKKFAFSGVAFVFFFAMAVYSPREASAIPAFARQTGFACSTCHYQHFPELNAFGREFKAGGFTMVGGQSLIEGEVLSLPSVLNGSLVTKAQYNSTWGNNGEAGTTGANVTGTPTQYDHGTWDFPLDASLFLAGRAGEHVGFLTEISLTQGVAGTMTFKIPFTFTAYGTKLDIIPYTSMDHGPAWGFEELNTGLTMQTPLLHASETSAAQYIGVASTPATGLAFVAYRPIGYINYSVWANDQMGFNGMHEHIASPLHYIRLAVTPNVGGWDLGFGGAGWFGTETRGPLDGPTRDSASAWALDAQAQGNVMNFPVGIYTSYAQASATSASDAANGKGNIFNAGDKNKSAWTILGEVGVIPNKLAASVGYRLGHNGDPFGTGENTTDDATTLALIYTPMLNFQFGIEHSWYAGSGSRSDESAGGWGTCAAGGAGCPATVNAGPRPTSGPGQLTTVTMWAAF